MNKTIRGLLLLAAIALLSTREDAMASRATANINAVDLDLVPSERDKFLEAIAEDAAATRKEPGRLQFDVCWRMIRTISSYTRFMKARRHLGRIGTQIISRNMLQRPPTWSQSA